MQRYLINVFAGVEVETFGPFNSEEERQEEAVEQLNQGNAATDSMLTLDIEDDGTVIVELWDIPDLTDEEIEAEEITAFEMKEMENLQSHLDDKYEENL
jgi:hypothetical protein